MIVKRWRSCIGSVFYVLWVSCNIEFIKISTISTTLLYTFCKWEYYLLVVDLQTSTIIIQYLPFIIDFHAIFFSAWRKKVLYLRNTENLKDMIEKLDYAMVPTGFVHCFNGNCKNANRCLRHQIIRFIPDTLWAVSVVNPDVPVLPESVRLSWRILPCNTLSAWITY